MKKIGIKSVLSSFIVHLAIFACIAGWSLYYYIVDNAGDGFVEVALVGAKGEINGGGIINEHRSRKSPLTPLYKGGESFSTKEVKGKAMSGSDSELGDSKTRGAGDPRLLQIVRRINKRKYYPEEARRESLEGVPRVMFSINPSGSVGDVNIIETSGSRVLDSAAIETIKKSSPLPFYPDPITISLRYSLKGN